MAIEPQCRHQHLSFSGALQDQVCLNTVPKMYISNYTHSFLWFFLINRLQVKYLTKFVNEFNWI